MREFIKYIYWFDPDSFGELQKLLDSKKISLFHSKKAVCVPLSKRIEIGFISPEGFRKNPVCERQLSWYDVSPYKDMYLVVSSINIDDLGFDKKPYVALQIKESNLLLKPSKTLPDTKTLEKLISQRGYQKLKPAKWEDINKDSDAQKRWMKIVGLRKITFSELFMYHCANHANFIEPMFYITKNHEKIPYSIAPTRYVCSCCLEIYDIIGTQFKKKLVIPCPGSVIFAGLKKDKFYEVTKLD